MQDKLPFPGGRWGRSPEKHPYLVPPCHPSARATFALRNYSPDGPFCEC